MKLCKVVGCTNECDPGRNYCHKHFLERKSFLRKLRKEAGLKVRTMYQCTCANCGKSFQGFKKDSLYCSQQCYIDFKKVNHSINAYEYDSKHYSHNIWKHRNIAEQILGRKLHTNEVVHHLDCNPKNNDLINLIILSRSKHGQLHAYLTKQRALLERSNKGITENCWNNLIVPMTTTWLETANVKVQKLWEIGQSAAELLNEKSQEEGSETMHGTSQVDEDIVQTTTLLK